MKVVQWVDDTVHMLDQRRLPGTVDVLRLAEVEEVAEGIRNMSVRGAPAIGIAAAYGMALASRRLPAHDLAGWRTGLRQAHDLLLSTRPTAVNLKWALERVERVVDAVASEGNAADFGALRPRLEEIVLREAVAIDDEDEAMCRRMGDFGADLMPRGACILTHCNAGALATGGYGTAVGVIRSAWARDHGLHVFVDETRPLLQGARLTAWELSQEGIPYTLITDNMAASFMRKGAINAVVVGSDRICANGDVTNKIGTYGVAVLARYHGLPFYVAAPFSTVDMALADGRDVEIEQRNPAEVTSFGGTRVAPADAVAANPAFDVTPAHLVTAIITERGVLRAPYTDSLLEASRRPMDLAGLAAPVLA